MSVLGPVDTSLWTCRRTSGTSGSPTSTVLAAEIREPPHVSQADGVAHTREQEVELALPAAPIGDLLLLRLCGVGGEIQLLKRDRLFHLCGRVQVHRALPGLSHGCGAHGPARSVGE